MFTFIKRLFGHKSEFVFADNPLSTIEINPTLVDVVHPVIQSIDSALTNAYKEKLFRNYQTKNPSISSQELEWRLFELKKYFLLTTVFNHVPMFSKAVDDLWHEMILFTREYNLFCEHLGVKIDHEPHLEPRFNPDERAFFDFMYSSFFQVDDAATHFYGEFFKHHLSVRLREMMNNDELDTFVSQFVRDSEQSKEIATKLWELVTKQFREVSPSSENANTNTNTNHFPLENYAYWMPTWFLLGSTNPEKMKHDGGTTYPGDHDSSDSSDSSSCSSCSGCGS